jgi:hypothetical protein
MPDSTSNKSAAAISGWALAAALFVLLAWLVMLLWLVVRVGSTEVEWARLFTVLSSLEAVAFAAAGALFGTTVQRQRVKEAVDRADKADARAQDADTKAAKSSQEAANGKALAAAVKARMSMPAKSVGTERVSAIAGDHPSDLLALAQRLFPD